MEEMKQAPVGSAGNADNAQSTQMNSQAGQAQMSGISMNGTQGAYTAMGAMNQTSQPQSGGFYQYVPGAGFVQVQGTQQMNPAMQGSMQNSMAGMDMQSAQSAFTGMQQGTYIQSASTAQAAASQTAMGAMTGMNAAESSDQSGMYGQAMPEGTQPKFDQNKIGQMYGVMSDVMNGEANPAQIMSLFQDTGTDFWKGAVVGAVGALLIGNETVRNTVAGVFGSMFGEADPEGPQVTVGAKIEE